MRIQVKRSFSGRLTAERWIAAGAYDVDDPALFGLAQYLVENGFADVLGGAVVDTTPAPVEAQEQALPDDSDVIVMPSADEPEADTAVYVHQGRKIKAGKPKP